MPKCKACGAPIIWVKLQSGKSMPCNPKLVYFYGMADPLIDQKGPGIFKTLITPDGCTCRGFVDYAGPRVGYESHFATCPAANQFRRRDNEK